MRISRRSGPAIALLGLAVVPFAWVGLAPAKTNATSSKQVGCGIERWSVKTGTDPNATQVDLENLVPAAIAAFLIGAFLLLALVPGDFERRFSEASGEGPSDFQPEVASA